MDRVDRTWNLISKEKRKVLIDETISFFERERDERIGIVAAELFIDFFLRSMGEDIYNKGVEDSKSLLKNRFEDLEMDLDVLLNK